MRFRIYIMIILTIIVTAVMVKEALAAPTLYANEYTAAEVIFNDVSIESKYHHLWLYEKVEPIELNDGNHVFVVTDGFYLYIMLGDQVQYIEAIDPVKASEELFVIAQNYNWFLRKIGWDED